MYKRRDSLCKLFDISFRLVDIILKEMEACKRYPKNVVMRDKGYVLVHVDAFKDYLQYRAVIKEAGIEKLPPFKVNDLIYLQAVE